MESMNSAGNSILEEIGKRITPLGMNGFKIVEKHNSKFYFAKFSIESKELLKIFNFIREIKVETYRKMYSTLKYTTQSSIVKFNPPLNTLNDNLKSLALFSFLFFHYYSTFSFDTDNSFEQYFNSEFLESLSEISIEIMNNDLFSRLVKFFYDTIQIAIKKLDYNKIKKLFQCYQPKAMNENVPLHSINQGCFYNPMSIILNSLKENKKPAENGNVENSMLNYIASTKEYLVELVYEAKTKQAFLEDNNKKLQNILDEVGLKTGESNHQITDNVNMGFTFANMSPDSSEKNSPKFTDYQKVNESFKSNSNGNSPTSLDARNSPDKMDVDDDSNQNSDDSPGNFSVPKPSSRYTKRVFSLLKKNEMDAVSENQMREITKLIDENYLDEILNGCTRTPTMLNDFISYIAELNSNHIRVLPKFKDFKEDVTMFFVVPARNIYYQVSEIFFSLFDLKIMGVGAYINMFKKKNLQPKFLDCYFKFLKGFKQIIVKRSAQNNSKKNMQEIFEVFLEQKNKEWMEMLREREKRINSRCNK